MVQVNRIVAYGIMKSRLQETRITFAASAKEQDENLYIKQLSRLSRRESNNETHAGVMDTADTVIMLRTEVSRPVGNEPQPYILI